MSWMATVDTPHGVTAGFDVPEILLGFSDALDEVMGTSGSAASVNTETGVVSATFTLDADTTQEAADVAMEIFNAALPRVGLPTGNIVHLDVEPMEDRQPVLA